MKQKISILILGLLFATTAHAATIYPVPETFWEKFLRCTWHISCYSESNKLGTSLTTINGSDTISGSRTTINTNFTNLNSGKIENSSTSIASITTLSNLSTIGTITSGLWNGTAIPVAYGGTGTTSPSTYNVMLGNGALGFTTASSTGTSGQLLTSNGSSAYPSWQSASFDTTQNYNVSGKWNFTSGATTTQIVATSTKLNGVISTYPSTQGASSTVLMNDGSGNLTNEYLNWDLLGEQVLTGANCTTTVTIPARQDLKIVLDTTGQSSSGLPELTFNTDYAGGGTNYSYKTFADNVASVSSKDQNVRSIFLSAAGTSTAYYLEATVNNDTALTKRVRSNMVTDTGMPMLETSIGKWLNTSNQITTVTIVADLVKTITFNTGTRLSVYGSRN